MLNRKMITQLTEENLDYTSLDKSNVGKWFIIVNGTWQGPYDTKEKAESVAKNL